MVFDPSEDELGTAAPVSPPSTIPAGLASVTSAPLIRLGPLSEEFGPFRICVLRGVCQYSGTVTGGQWSLRKKFEKPQTPCAVREVTTTGSRPDLRALWKQSGITLCITARIIHKDVDTVDQPASPWATAAIVRVHPGVRERRFPGGSERRVRWVGLRAARPQLGRGRRGARSSVLKRRSQA